MSYKNLFARHKHWSDVQTVVQKLNSAGFTAYLAGGAVRDALLGQSAKDFDVATDAKPEDVEKLFKKTISVGRQFGVMIVPFENDKQKPGHQIEITTFRKDGEYKDGRHPSSVKFCAPEEDAKRRDFTVNALFYDLAHDRIIDYVGGIKDLERKVLRAVGDPAQRFTEDKLRVLRATRFAGQLGFAIEAKTLAAVREFAEQITVVSPERITEEVKKLLRAPHLRDGMQMLRDVGLLKAIWPTLSFVSDAKRWQKFLPTLNHMAGAIEVFIAIAFVFEGEARQVPFILSREQKRRVEFLARGFEHLKCNEIDVLLDLNEEDGPLLTEMALALADAELLERNTISMWIDQFLKAADESGELPKPLVSGDDLLKLGFKASAKFGEVLAGLYTSQLRGEITNRDQALTAARKLLKS